MKYFDEVKLIKQRYCYTEEDIHVGEIGTIIFPEIRDNEFYVQFETDDAWNAYKYCMVKIEDLEIVKEGNFTDEQLLNSIPNNNPNWWCKVEDGYILNLLGEKKNKIPYDYNS